MTKRSPEHEIVPEAALRSESPWPLTYRIVVGGRLDASWSDRLAGMLITPHTTGGSSEQTRLVGPIRDQAELSGVLNTLYDLRLCLLRVEVTKQENLSEETKPKQGVSE